MPFHQRLKMLRERHNLTQQELGQALGGLKISTISSYESGKREPSIDIIEKIASYFRCSTDFLLGRTEVLFPPKEYEDLDIRFVEVYRSWRDDGHSPDEIRKIWDDVRRLTESYRKENKS